MQSDVYSRYIWCIITQIAGWTCILDVDLLRTELPSRSPFTQYTKYGTYQKGVL